MKVHPPYPPSAPTDPDISTTRLMNGTDFPSIVFSLSAHNLPSIFDWSNYIKKQKYMKRERDGTIAPASPIYSTMGRWAYDR